jgi:hypothetical protein
MNVAKQFIDENSRGDLNAIIDTYKNIAKRPPTGYLNTNIFQRMRDGKNDDAVRDFFAGPFAQVRIWLPEMFGLYISRFTDHPYTYVIVDNLSDEYGKYFGHKNFEPSHAQLYRRVLDELEVKVAENSMSTPVERSSQAAANFYDWFKEQTTTKLPSYMIGHFLAYEITDVLDFPDYLVAAHRLWPQKSNVHEFFTQHAESAHDATFARDLENFFEQNRQKMIEGMGNLLEQWTTFYQQASEEVGA